VKKINEDRFLPAGTKVRRDAFVNDNAFVTAEYGVVIHCWWSDEIDSYDCYVAFFGENGHPEAAPEEKPYILRYAAASLTILPS
jgi:hypothetical protein